MNNKWEQFSNNSKKERKRSRSRGIIYFNNGERHEIFCQEMQKCKMISNENI